MIKIIIWNFLFENKKIFKGFLTIFIIRQIFFCFNPWLILNLMFWYTIFHIRQDLKEVLLSIIIFYYILLISSMMTYSYYYDKPFNWDFFIMKPNYLI
jgi:hypothetical protein